MWKLSSHNTIHRPGRQTIVILAHMWVVSSPDPAPLRGIRVWHSLLVLRNSVQAMYMYTWLYGRLIISGTAHKHWCRMSCNKHNAHRRNLAIVTRSTLFPRRGWGLRTRLTCVIKVNIYHVYADWVGMHACCTLCVNLIAHLFYSIFLLRFHGLT